MVFPPSVISASHGGVTPNATNLHVHGGGPGGGDGGGDGGGTCQNGGGGDGGGGDGGGGDGGSKLGHVSRLKLRSEPSKPWSPAGSACVWHRTPTQTVDAVAAASCSRMAACSSTEMGVCVSKRGMLKTSCVASLSRRLLFGDAHS